MSTKMPNVDPVRQEAAAIQLGAHFEATQNTLIDAYSLKEGTTKDDPNFKKVYQELGFSLEKKNGQESVPEKFSIRALQLVAEQRFQRASQVLTLFTTLCDKVDQMKQRIISNFSN